MLKNIPTHLIAGPLGAGKTSLIRALLAQKPPSENWAVLINEFGQIGLDAALLHQHDQGVTLSEVPGGCLCCVNGVPFQTGLTRLLRKARPQRLLIEPSGLGHPLQLLLQLRQPPWNQVLSLQPPLIVLDASALAGGTALMPEHQNLVAQAGLLVLNKSEALDDNARAAVQARLPDRPVSWVTQGQLPLHLLPGLNCHATASAEDLMLPSTPPALGNIWLDPRHPVVLCHAGSEGWSIGWRWNPDQVFDLQRVREVLASLPWRRAKLVLRTETGWLAANAVDGSLLAFKASEWRRDSRLELIFNEEQEQEGLKRRIAYCLTTQ